MSRKVQYFVQAFLSILQAIGEPLADYLEWTNTEQVLFHGLLAAVQLQVAGYAQQFNVDGTKPPLANVKTTTQVETTIEPRKETP